MTSSITLPDGRTLSYADYGKPGDLAVFWCHGGPGSRLEPQGLGGGGDPGRLNGKLKNDCADASVAARPRLAMLIRMRVRAPSMT